MKLPEKIAFVDTETTGGNAQRDRIIEIGIVRVEKGQVTRTWNSLVDPQQYLPPEIKKITGIDDKDLEKAPIFRNISDELEEILSDCIFAAHNSRFDYSFVKSEMGRVGKKLKNKQLCTVKLSRALFPEYARHNLDEIAQRFALKIENRHRALDDAIAIWEFYKLALAEKGEEIFAKTIKELLLHPSTPSRIDQSELEKLPELPGVYIFYGDKGMPLYVGKSINIKERVMSHLSESMRDHKEMRLASEVASIETEECSGELGALLRETTLVKQMQPLYNRQLRQSRKLVFLAQVYEGKYKTVEMNNGAFPTAETVGVFRSERIAQDFLRQKARDYNLCEKLLKTEKWRPHCFACDLGKCTACLNLEDPIEYNMRFDIAFGAEKLGAWPFAGPIVVKEHREAHVFDNWCYLGKMSRDAWEENGQKFDLDIFKILRRFLRHRDNWKKVKVIAGKSKGGFEI